MADACCYAPLLLAFSHSNPSCPGRPAIGPSHSHPTSRHGPSAQMCPQAGVADDAGGDAAAAARQGEVGRARRH
eukprot:6343216-Lingulodinium_polyedra.AAC.1